MENNYGIKIFSKLNNLVKTKINEINKGKTEYKTLISTKDNTIQNINPKEKEVYFIKLITNLKHLLGY